VKKLLLTILLMMPLCGSGEFDRVSFPVLYADADMPLFACQLEINDDTIGLFQPVILLFAGEPKYKGGGYHQLDLVKAMTTAEFLEALDAEREEP
jgi:hypothetical protein